MFERYTEKARRVIFFARYEASQLGQRYIETEHILLGILREDKALTKRFLRKHSTVESIRKQIEEHTLIGEKTPTSVDLPLSNECKRVLAYAAEEMDRLGHKYLGTEHLLLGILREEGSFAAALLKERGVQLDALRKELAQTPHAEPQMPGGPSAGGGGGVTGARLAMVSTALTDFARDLTQVAAESRLDPLIGRDEELDAVIEILCRQSNKNPILVGERGVGKSAIVEGLAQRIADGVAPGPLATRRIMALDAQIVASWILQRRNSEDRLNSVVKAMIETPDVILFVDDLHLFIEAVSASGSAVAGGILKHWLRRGKLDWIGACTPDDYARLTQVAPWVRECFCAVHVRALNEEQTLPVVASRKGQLESFHGVSYADDAVSFAVHSSAGYRHGTPLPGRALELLDAAGARVQLCRGGLPTEVLETMQKIKAIVQRLDSAMANHEFEKARFYSDEERKERDNLRQLHAKHHLEDAQPEAVTRADVEEVMARAAGYPFAP